MVPKLVICIARSAAFRIATKIAKWDIRINIMSILYQFFTKKPSRQFNEYIDWWQTQDSPIGYLIGYLGIELTNFLLQIDVMMAIIFLAGSWLIKKCGPKIRSNPILPKDD